MYTFTKKIIRSLLAFVLAIGGLALTGSRASAATYVIDLCAVAGTATLLTTGPVTVPIWGWTLGDCTGTPVATLPGPVLTVNEGDIVTITVHNALPTVSATGDISSGFNTVLNLSTTSNLGPGMTVSGAGVPPGAMIVSIDSPTSITISQAATATTVGVALTFGHRISFEAPGVVFSPGSTDADPGGTVSRTFTVITNSLDTDPTHTKPGTYLYQSGGDAGRQEAMGLYGALIVLSGTLGQAYDTATTAYDVEATLVLSQVDPNFNAAPETYSMYDYHATYWLINGKAYPDTAPIVMTGSSGRKLLLRYVNAGYDNTTMMLLGMHEQVLARDANLLNNSFSANAETIPAGGTEDAIATVPSSVPQNLSGGFPLYNRQLHDGMMTFIQP